jgi:uncharacterized OB-fold protein
MDATHPTRVPVIAGLFEGEGDSARLLASRCAGCGTHYFPRALSCRNPACRDKRLQDTTLSPRGTLYSYTRQCYQPPALFRMDNWAPYSLGLVELPEGLRVMGMVSGTEPQPQDIGQAVRLSIEMLYHDEQGREVSTFTWRLVGEGDAP